MSPHKLGADFYKKIALEAGMTGMKGLFNLGKIGALKAITSDFAKNKIKGMADKYIYHINCGVVQGFPALRKAVTTHMKNIVFFMCVDRANQLLTRHSPLVPLGQVDE